MHKQDFLHLALLNEDLEIHMEERCPNRECAVVIVEGIITKEGL